jgi:GTP-binding protein EngB required for normal cell division
MKGDLLNVLSEIKTRVQDKLGTADFPMPQFILIGGQSVGKSRLIESLAGEQFNFISGTLGSRRPTVLEFRNVQGPSKWYYLDGATNQWQLRPTAQVQEIVSKAHTDLGNSISSEPVNLRIESSSCVDMQIVDLPGYRGFASDAAAEQLKKKIEDLNRGFLEDDRNVILCVEEAGDAANLWALRKVTEVDPSYKRTILIRSKLDKYYSDLTASNVHQWLEGFGDLPKNLTKFALTLPHWSDGQPPPKPLVEMRKDQDKQDRDKLANLGCSKRHLDMVGFDNFSTYMEKRTEIMFTEAIGPVMTKMKDLEQAMTLRVTELKDEMEQADPSQMLASVRACGVSFANCLTHIMEGYIRSDINRMSLETELREFHNYHEKLNTDSFDKLPTDDFGNMDDYIMYLNSESMKVPAYEVEINGGAQFRRLMYEVEVFLRFSEVGNEIKKKDVLQAFGISMSSVTWREVVVKLLNHNAHLPLQRRIQYVGERVRWFFIQQKDPIVQFMKGLKGSPDEKLFSVNFSRHAQFIEDNQTIKKLVYDTYDRVVDRQLKLFVELFKSTLHATFANPWVFLKKTTAKLGDADEEDPEFDLPTMEDTKARIPDELESRNSMDNKVTKWLYEIPTEPQKVEEAVDQVQLLVLKVYSHIRSQVCNNVELFAESFFKLPLMRRLEEDMMKIELSDVDREGYRVRRERLQQEQAANTHGLKEVKDCLRILQEFTFRAKAVQAAQ